MGIEARARDWKREQIFRALGSLYIVINILVTWRKRSYAINRLRFSKLYALISVYFTVCNYVSVIQVLPREK